MTRIAPISSSLHVVAEAGSLLQRLRAVRVLVDGVEQTRLRPGEQVLVEVLPGARRVQVRRGRSAGAELALELEPGERVALGLVGVQLRVAEPEGRDDPQDH